MGQCCSFVRRSLPLSQVETSSDHDHELLAGESMPAVHSIDVDMSAPSITVANDLKNEVTGSGLALAETPVEQDRAYWEWRVKVVNDPPDDASPTTLMFGVSNKRNSKFYEILAESSVPPEKHGTKFMNAVPNLKDGDVVGVTVRQSEIPMVQLYLNGEIIGGGDVSRFRGTVFPSVYLPHGCAVSATFLYRDDQFVHGPPIPGLEPLIAERSLM